MLCSRSAAVLSLHCPTLQAQRRAASRPAVAQASSKRELLQSAAALVAVPALLGASPAHAFLGIGEDRTPIYVADTGDVIKKVKNAISLDKDDAGREAALSEVREQTNAWVAKYRRDDKFAGRPSYGNTYTAVNALAGHLNSFGPAAPIPKKRLERINKELEDATKFLQRGRRVTRTGFLKLTTKNGPRNYYKGKGVPSLGRHTNRGSYILQQEKLPQYVVPDLTGFPLKAYVEHTARRKLPIPPST